MMENEWKSMAKLQAKVRFYCWLDDYLVVLGNHLTNSQPTVKVSVEPVAHGKLAVLWQY